jgi:hypothetical protein
MKIANIGLVDRDLDHLFSTITGACNIAGMTVAEIDWLARDAVVAVRRRVGTVEAHMSRTVRAVLKRENLS